MVDELVKKKDFSFLPFKGDCIQPFYRFSQPGLLTNLESALYRTVSYSIIKTNDTGWWSVIIFTPTSVVLV